MRFAYLDTSFLLSILLGEPGAVALRRQLQGFDRVFSCDLLTAETLTALRREGVDLDDALSALEGVSLVFPDRTLLPEMRRVLAAGLIRGADLWHLACAVFLFTGERSTIGFLTRDKKQRVIAGRLGFLVP